DPLMSAIWGGLFIGVGVGLMLRLEISIGGTDLLAQMIARKLSVNPGVMIFCIDILIVTMGSILIPSVHLVLSFTTVFIVGLTTSIIVSKTRKVIDVKA